MRNNFSVETAELTEADLDNVSGGITAGVSANAVISAGVCADLGGGIDASVGGVSVDASGAGVNAGVVGVGGLSAGLQA